jgi:UDP-glucose 4-epimerase
VAEEVTGRKVPVQEATRRPGDPPVLVAAADRAQKELGWRPRYADLRPVVETAWNWHRAHPGGYDD